MLAARCKAIRRVQASNPEKSEAEIQGKLVAYTSEQVSTKIYFTSYYLHKWFYSLPRQGLYKVHFKVYANTLTSVNGLTQQQVVHVSSHR